MGSRNNIVLVSGLSTDRYAFIVNLIACSRLTTTLK